MHAYMMPQHVPIELHNLHVYPYIERTFTSAQVWPVCGMCNDHQLQGVCGRLSLLLKLGGQGMHPTTLVVQPKKLLTLGHIHCFRMFSAPFASFDNCRQATASPVTLDPPCRLDFKSRPWHVQLTFANGCVHCEILQWIAFADRSLSRLRAGVKPFLLVSI